MYSEKVPASVAFEPPMTVNLIKATLVSRHSKEANRTQIQAYLGRFSTHALGSQRRACSAASH